VIAVTDAAGNVVERYAYTDYGCPTITDGAGVPVLLNVWGTAQSAIGNSYLFTGRQWDKESGLYYYRARHFTCSSGRFLQVDPLGRGIGSEAYGFPSTSPINNTDPSGKMGQTVHLSPAPYRIGGRCSVADYVSGIKRESSEIEKIFFPKYDVLDDCSCIWRGWEIHCKQILRCHCLHPPSGHHFSPPGDPLSRCWWIAVDCRIVDKRKIRIHHIFRANAEDCARYHQHSLRVLWDRCMGKQRPYFFPGQIHAPRRLP